MSTITRERVANLLQFNSEGSDCQSNAEQWEVHELARIALASIEADAVAWLLSGGGAKNNVSFDSGNAYADPLREVTPLYTAPPAPVSVPAAYEHTEDFSEYHEGWNACRSAMLQGAGPLTIKANGGGSEKDEPPKRGWVVTHSGKDYFYREQGDAATHMNAAVESGRKVSLRSFIPETVTAAYKSPDSWMDCRDQNPEKGRHLALFGKRTKENCDPYVDEGYLGSDGEFYFFDWEGGPRINDCDPYDKAEVTHWMYRDLPAAPQQEVKP